MQEELDILTTALTELGATNYILRGLPAEHTITGPDENDLTIGTSQDSAHLATGCLRLIGNNRNLFATNRID